jgi:arginine decarboxylase
MNYYGRIRSFNVFFRTFVDYFKLQIFVTFLTFDRRMRKWRIEDSAELYNISGWGLKYFSINDKGHVQVTPREGYASVDLKDLMDELQVRDITSPVLLRFPDILDNRIEKISRCFKQAAAEYKYEAQNFIIYPIKVNQMRQVVEEIVSHGKKFNIGLEAGSKPELHAVLATNIDESNLIICNGYKDENYIELALLAQKMGRHIFLVVEKLNELRLIATLAKRIGVRPNVGIRIKLSSSGSGKWEESGGDHSKFGLNSSELLEALDFLEKNKMKECLKLIHFHIGSQITKIRRIKTALREATQFYVQLSKMGFNLDFLDIGGGLGVDYDGTRSSASESSMNYSIQEYANDAISALVDACEKNGLKQPNIITESGRSLTAHHSVLIFEALETTQLPIWNENEEVSETDHELARELYDIWDKLNPPRLLESWHDALQIREEALDLFSLGMLDLRTRAQIEKLFWSVARDVNDMAQGMKHIPDELKISKMLPDKYFCNFSLFQSLPDSWAIDQMFPIMPIARLDERPTRTATIQDITCDSDGKINNFISSHGICNALPVHSLKNNESYYFGVFLVGAYQEILGDMHNLFGDTNAVHISVYADRYEIDQIIDGETVDEVLDYVQYNPKKLVRNVETWVTRAMKSGKITPEEGREFLSNYRSGLYGYTYLEKD